MLSLFLIIMLVVSIVKPEVLFSRKMKEKANEEQKVKLAQNLRKEYAIIVGLLESISIMRYSDIIGIALTIICLILFWKIGLPARKETFQILKEIE